MTSENVTTMSADQLALDFEIDALCDEFESEWKRGERPEIKAFASRISPQARDALTIELIRLDIAYRSSQGESCTLHEYETLVENKSLLTEELAEELPSTGAAAPPPQRLGRFDLLEMVGQGSFGSVWKATDTSLNRIVAVKLLRDHLIGATERALFEREARALAMLKHSNVVAVHEFGEVDGRPFIVSEFMDGGTLRSMLADQKIAPRKGAEIALALADALQHCHGKGVVHRDLKPGNILFDKQGRPAIADFGLAKHLDGQTTIAQEGDLIGTLAYMSPEQAGGDSANVGPESDIYALGVMLYEMLTGVRPFDGKGKEIIQQILQVEPDPPRKRNEEIPVALETICLKCMAKEKKDRYASAGDLLVDLQRYLAGRPIVARRPSRLARVRRWIRRNPGSAGIVSFGGAAGFLAAAAVIFALSTLDRDDSLEPRVTLDTVPQGATVSFVPLHPRTNEPLPEQIIHAAQRTPLAQKLPAGNYLVVARLEDGSGRFHEVYRHVPEKKELGGGTGGPYHHMRWDELADGRIKLPTIGIPAADIAASGMALIAGSDHFLMGVEGSLNTPEHLRRVPSFYIDQTEVTVAAYRSVTFKGRLPASLHYRPAPNDWAICVDWNEAVDRAEELGKRLPGEAEFEYAATGGGRFRFSWEEACSEEDLERLFAHRDELGPVGTPAEDRLLTDLPVYGLCSNAAEWTMSYGPAFYQTAERKRDHGQDLFFRELEQFRVYRGGDNEVAMGKVATVVPSERDPRMRNIISAYSVGNGLGFRCVRSTKPRLLPSDFVGAPSE